MPSLRLLTPSSGPSYGHTSIVIDGVYLHNQTANLTCRFGDRRVPATVLTSGSSVRCVAPSAVSAGAESTLLFHFGSHSASTLLSESIEGEQGAYDLKGSATILDDGSLSLTNNDYHLIGSIAIKTPTLVSPIIRSFDAQFGVYIGDGSGGQGVSFCYGQLPVGALGAAGVDSGLCIRMLTRDMDGLPAQALQIMLDGQVLRDLDIKEVTGNDQFLRVRTTMPVRIAYDTNGLHISYGASHFFEGVQLPYWSPTETWQFAIGASTTEWRDAHRISHLRLHVGAFVESSAVDVAITSNGQQVKSQQQAMPCKAAHSSTPHTSHPSPLPSLLSNSSRTIRSSSPTIQRL